MVLRSAIGAFATVAIIGAVAAALPERRVGAPASSAKQAPFGDLTKPAFDPAKAVPPASAQAPSGDADKSGLLKLAAYKVPQPAPAAPAEPAPQPTPPAADNQAAVQPIAPSLLAPTPIGGDIRPTPAPATPPEPAPKPEVVAALAPPPPTSPATPANATGVAAGQSRVAGKLVNINRASVEELDHIPGGGRIGRSIARRRPYHSVDDLVHKRVLRESAFRRIRGYVSVD